jgi:hypothetical protein
LRLIPEENKSNESAIIAQGKVNEPALKKGSTVNIEDYMVQAVRKEAKRANLFNIVTTTEPRLLTVFDGCLYVFRPITHNKALQTMSRFFTKKVP